jgi:6-phosphofructokinase 1
VIGVPKTIDNDIPGTDQTFGFDTAVAIATAALDRISTTAESHNRIMVVEVMGRSKGWIATYAGIAAGADAILVPELKANLEEVADTIRASIATATIRSSSSARVASHRSARPSAPGSMRSGSSGSAASAYLFGSGSSG